MSDVSKLPKWAREKIASLERCLNAQAETIRTLEKSNHESPVWFSSMAQETPNGGQIFRDIYLPIPNKHPGTAYVKWAGMTIQIRLHYRQEEIEISYEALPSDTHKNVSMQPTSHQGFKLKVIA